MEGSFFDVAAQAHDEIVDGARVGVFVQAPDVFEDGFARNGAAVVPNQVAQQLGFHQSELDGVVLGAQFKVAEVDGLAVEGKARRRAARWSSTPAFLPLVARTFA